MRELDEHTVVLSILQLPHEFLDLIPFHSLLTEMMVCVQEQNKETN